MSKEQCDKCSRSFKTLPGLRRHKTRSHFSAPPPPPPVKTILRVANGDLETLTLQGGQDLDVGDVFWQTRKFVIKKITKTAGESTVEVEAEVTKRTWSRTEVSN
jgi:hypothetical protein